jgi:hypothetical protein
MRQTEIHRMTNDATIKNRLVAPIPPTPILLPMSELSARNAFVQDGNQAGFDEFLERAEAGSPAAQAVVAFIYLNRWLDDEDYLVTAANWAMSSANKNESYGRWVLAWALLEQGDIRNGIPEMVQAAESGFLPALYDLGMFLREGVVFPKRPEVGCAFLRAAAQGGHFSSYVALKTAAKLGAFGPTEKWMATLTLPLIKLVRIGYWLLFQRKFTEKDLVYVRSMHVRNSIRREFGGESVSFGFEKMLDEKLSQIQFK